MPWGYGSEGESWVLYGNIEAVASAAGIRSCSSRRIRHRNGSRRDGGAAEPHDRTERDLSPDRRPRSSSPRRSPRSRSMANSWRSPTARCITDCSATSRSLPIPTGGGTATPRRNHRHLGGRGRRMKVHEARACKSKQPNAPALALYDAMGLKTRLFSLSLSPRTGVDHPGCGKDVRFAARLVPEGAPRSGMMAALSNKLERLT